MAKSKIYAILSDGTVWTDEKYPDISVDDRMNYNVRNGISGSDGGKRPGRMEFALSSGIFRKNRLRTVILMISLGMIQGRLPASAENGTAAPEVKSFS